MRTLTTLLLSVITALCATAQDYCLPRTALRIHLLIEKQTYTPGDYARYAETYLRLSGISQQQQVSHRVIACDITTIGLRDTTKQFTLHLKGKGEQADIRLSPDGVLLAINAEPIATAAPAFRQTTQPHTQRPQQPSPWQLLSAEALAAGSHAKTAEITALQIAELRDRRQQLITGEADDTPQDEHQLQRMIQQIDGHISTLTSLFTGTTQRDTTLHTLLLCPDKEIERDVLFRLSRRLGLVDADDLSGTPYYITIKNLYPREVPLPENKKGEHVYANVPGTAAVSIFQDGLQLGTFHIPLAQFGYVELRDGSVFKKQTTHMTFNPSTGAVAQQYTDVED